MRIPSFVTCRRRGFFSRNFSTSPGSARQLFVPVLVPDRIRDCSCSGLREIRAPLHEFDDAFRTTFVVPSRHFLRRALSPTYARSARLIVRANSFLSFFVTCCCARENRAFRQSRANDEIYHSGLCVARTLKKKGFSYNAVVKCSRLNIYCLCQK